jgi:predicted amidohydrolase
MARAIENQAYMAAVNRFGREGQAEYPGHSAGIDFLGKPAFPVLMKEEIKVFTCSHPDLSEFRKNFPFLP